MTTIYLSHSTQVAEGTDLKKPTVVNYAKKAAVVYVKNNSVKKNIVN